MLWEYHRLRHPDAATDVGIVLGCHDIGVADVAAAAWARSRVRWLVVTGATGPASRDRFPDGEARAFADRVTARGVPADAVLIEPDATNTGQNITYSRALLARHGITPAEVSLICMPYMERRAWATCRAQWPEVRAWCVSSGQSLAEYLDLMSQRDGMHPGRVVDMMVGDLQRIIVYPSRGFSVTQDVPERVHDAFTRLIEDGHTSTLLPE